MSQELSTRIEGTLGETNSGPPIEGVKVIIERVTFQQKCMVAALSAADSRGCIGDIVMALLTGNAGPGHRIAPVDWRVEGPLLMADGSAPRSEAQAKERALEVFTVVDIASLGSRVTHVLISGGSGNLPAPEETSGAQDEATQSDGATG